MKVSGKIALSVPSNRAPRGIVASPTELVEEVGKTESGLTRIQASTILWGCNESYGPYLFVTLSEYLNS
jgi:hypothetical protein